MQFGDVPATGVALSSSGRVFVCFPRWFKNGTTPGLVESRFSVAEIGIKFGPDRIAPYPNAAMNSWKAGDDPSVGFVNVQSVFVDHFDRLWILEPGAAYLGNITRGAPRLPPRDHRSLARRAPHRG